MENKTGISIWCVVFIFTLMIGVGCRQVPRKKIPPFKVSSTYSFKADSLVVKVENEILCPIFLKASSEDSSLQALLNLRFPIFLKPLQDSTIVEPGFESFQEEKISFRYTLGDHRIAPEDTTISIPFPKGKAYKVIQGYHGSYSHSSSFSRYAVDFAMAVGDTITAAADGYVVGVIEDYKHGGRDRKWRPYANWVTVFHPDKNIFTQYVHLQYKGSLVEVGDTVKTNQPIAISGLTGFTSGPHLHFNVLKATEEGFVSIPCTYYKNIPGQRLTRGTLVRRKKN
ncbi:MAG: M23 family metallopeptidase [Bacteroidia bacterium]|nr:M23 family metallopeptidase [Bacteroidia bacterium]